MKRVLQGVVIIILLCSGLMLGEWAYTEITFQEWMRQDEHRIDFSIYDSEEQLRDALLTKLPIGSSEEELKAFHLANREEGSKWEPKEVSSDNDGIVLRVVMVSAAKRGIIFNRKNNRWIILFLLDPINHTLVDTKVGRFSAPQWP